jgi:hypothetical protein
VRGGVEVFAMHPWEHQERTKVVVLLMKRKRANDFVVFIDHRCVFVSCDHPAERAGVSRWFVSHEV